MGSTYRQPSLGRISVTWPRIAAIRYLLAWSATDIAARGSRLMSFVLPTWSQVQTRDAVAVEPDSDDQLRGDPSARSVARWT
jgi:hypothetical protein